MAKQLQVDWEKSDFSKKDLRKQLMRLSKKDLKKLCKCKTINVPYHDDKRTVVDRLLQQKTTQTKHLLSDSKPSSTKPMILIISHKKDNKLPSCLDLNTFIENDLQKRKHGESQKKTKRLRSSAAACTASTPPAFSYTAAKSGGKKSFKSFKTRHPLHANGAFFSKRNKPQTQRRVHTKYNWDKTPSYTRPDNVLYSVFMNASSTSKNVLFPVQNNSNSPSTKPNGPRVRMRMSRSKSNPDSKAADIVIQRQHFKVSSPNKRRLVAIDDAPLITDGDMEQLLLNEDQDHDSFAREWNALITENQHSSYQEVSGDNDTNDNIKRTVSISSESSPQPSNYNRCSAPPPSEHIKK